MEEVDVVLLAAVGTAGHLDVLDVLEAFEREVLRRGALVDKDLVL